jgi:lysyl-tRNA synthetase class 2
MLEWYRGYADLEQVAEDLSELVMSLGGAKPKVTTFRDLFKQLLGVDLVPNTPLSTYRSWCEKEKMHFDATDTLTDLFHRLWIDRIEPHLSEPTIVRDFPPEQAALARIRDDGWADRFEFFWNGLEIANAFHEVNDPQEQALRWRLEQKERQRLGHMPLPQDSDLLERMEKLGMPPTGGIALGLERLFMAAHGIKDIRQLKLFPYR